MAGRRLLTLQIPAPYLAQVRSDDTIADCTENILGQAWEPIGRLPRWKL
jgi:hypothetical protein